MIPLTPKHLTAMRSARLNDQGEHRLYTGRCGSPSLSRREAERLVAAGYLKRIRREAPDFPYYVLTQAGIEQANRIREEEKADV